MTPTTPSPISDQAAGGWKLVPIETTPEMAKAGMDQWYKTFTQHDLYVAMVNAAPTAPTTGSAPEINQCDGCRVNAPLTERYGNHAMPDGGFMACTKDRYAAAASPAASVQRNTGNPQWAKTYQAAEKFGKWNEEFGWHFPNDDDIHNFAKALLAASMGGEKS